MSRSPAKRKQRVGPDLGLAPGERGFAKWLRQSIAATESEIAIHGTKSLAEAKALLKQRRGARSATQKSRKAG
jgi:hypothetical protein